jgi:biopolymer transport protein ExbD
MHHATARKRHLRERRNPPEEDPEFQIAPMIDILLVLLVFFMSISSTEVLQKNVEMQLPVARDAKNKKEGNPGQIIVNVAWVALNNLGSIVVNDKHYAMPSEIVPLLQHEMLANPTLRVLIRADKAVRYEYMRTVLKAVGDAGVTNVTFSVVDKEGQKPAQP